MKSEKKKSEELKQVTKSSERQEQSLTQAQIDSLRQGQRLDAIDQNPKHDSSKTEVKLDTVILEAEGKPEAKQSRHSPCKDFPSHKCNSHPKDALTKPCAQQVFQEIKQVSPLFDHFSQKFSPLLAHAHIKPKRCINLPLKSCYAMNVVQRVYVKHSSIHRYDYRVTSMCAL